MYLGVSSLTGLHREGHVQLDTFDFASLRDWVITV